MRQHLAFKHGGDGSPPLQECRWLHRQRRHAATCRLAVTRSTAQDLIVHQAVARQVGMHGTVMIVKFTCTQGPHGPLHAKECLAFELQVCYRLDRSRTSASVQNKLLCFKTSRVLQNPIQALGKRMMLWNWPCKLVPVPQLWQSCV